ncbi:MAG: carbohydrate ABC transporter permease, partial [Christensenella sp.]
MIRRLRGKKAGDLFAQAAIWTILMVLLIVFSVPFLFMISNSFEEFSFVLPYPPKLFPTRLDFSAYRYVLSQPFFPIAVKNSVINTAVTVVLSVFISTLSAYGFARIDFPGRETLFKLYLFTLMVPSFLNIIPQFILLKGIRIPGTDMNLIGTRAGLILVYVATNVCGHTFFLRNFFRSLPDALSESVIVDGGGHGTIFFKVMLPLSKPAIGTMSIFALQGFWE